MTYKISINSGETVISIDETKTLYQALADEGIDLPSACGGRGICGRCKTKVVSPKGELNDRELKKLSTEEQADGYRLACQLEITQDTEILLPSEVQKTRRFTGHLEKMEQLTYDIRKLRIKLERPDTISFVPGRFIQLDIPPYPGSDKPLRRSYSLASSPSDNGHIELIIRRVPDGKSTTYIFEHIKEGDPISFSGPFGEFGLSDTDKPMIWIAGGSGMGPFLSMLAYCRENGISRPVKFFYGACTEKDLFYENELCNAQQELGWFEFIPALSNPSDSWQGRTGLITEVVSRCIDNNPHAEGYLCGSPGMCEAAIKTLNEKGIPSQHIYHDKFIGQESLDTKCLDGRTVSWNPEK